MDYYNGSFNRGMTAEPDLSLNNQINAVKLPLATEEHDQKPDEKGAPPFLALRRAAPHELASASPVEEEIKMVVFH